MAEKKAVPTKAPAKAPTKAPAKAAKKPEKGSSLTCEVCGMSVIVDEVCDCVEVHEILCCSKPMKPQKTAKKVKAKAAAK